MKIFQLILLFSTLATTCFSQMKIELAAFPTNEAIECGPNSLQITWINTSDKPLMLGPDLSPELNSALTIIVNNQIRLQGQGFGTHPVITKSALEPGEKVSGSIGVFELRLDPGDYKIQAVADFSNFPQEYFHGRIESNTIDLHFRWPTGEDLLAYEWAFQKAFPSKEKYEEELKRSADPKYEYPVRGQICGPLAELEIFKLFPKSIYSSYLLYESIYKPSEEDPSALMNLITDGTFPGWNSVRDPEAGGWIEIESGKAMAQWQIKSSERILENTPNFPFADQLRINIAVCNIAIGKKDQAVNLLNTVSEKTETKEGKWAAQFVQYVQASNP